MRYIIEGEWSGYTSAQRRVVHREIATKTKAEKARALHAIGYTDGTTLVISVRECKPREQVQERHSYTSLINKALAHGGSFVSVRDLP